MDYLVEGLRAVSRSRSGEGLIESPPGHPRTAVHPAHALRAPEKPGS
jgi:hypothetical protein